LNVGFRKRVAVAGDGSVEIQFQNAREDVRPVEGAAAAGIVDEGRGLARRDYVADADNLLGREINDGIAAGVGSAEVMKFDGLSAEFDRVFGSRISDAGRRRLRIRRVSHQILLQVLCGYYGDSSVQESLVVAGVILVVVGDDEVFDRFIRGAFDEGHQVVVVRLTGKLAVYQNDAFAGNAECRVAACAGDQIE